MTGVLTIHDLRDAVVALAEARQQQLRLAGQLARKRRTHSNRIEADLAQHRAEAEADRLERVIGRYQRTITALGGHEYDGAEDDEGELPEA